MRAGFVVTFRNDEFLQIVGEHFGEALNAPEFLGLDDDEARTHFLRSRVPLATVKDPAARAAACRALGAFEADLGVDVSDCGEALAAPSATLEGH